jgi:HK97 gp10 family phage protein
VAFAIKGTFTGLDDVFKRLGHLNRTVRNRILRAAINEATKPLLDDAKQRAPRQSGLLRKSLGRKVKTYRASGVVVAIIGPRSKPSFKRQVTVRDKRTGKTRSEYRNPVKYAHLQEQGRKAVRVKRGRVLGRKGVYFGKQAAAALPRPFLRPAFAAGKARAEQTMRRRILEEVLKEAAKGGRGGRR